MATNDNLIPPGRYKARGVDGKLALTNDGKPQVAVLVRIEDEGPWNGWEMTWYGYFSEKSQKRTIESLRFLGWQGDDLDNLVGIDGNEVSLTVEHDTGDDGVTRAKAAWINRAGAIAVKNIMDDGTARNFAERMKGLVMKVSQEIGTAAPAPSKGNGNGGNRPPARQQNRPPTQNMEQAMGLDPSSVPF